MKTIKIIMIVMALFLYKASYCDLIPDNSHYVEKCVKITNVNDYQEISLIGYIDAFVYDGECYLISSSQCLYKGYQLNSFFIYAVSNNYLVGKNINVLDWPNDKNAFIANVVINPYYGYISNSSPLSGIEQYYKIMGFTDTAVILYKWKEINKFNDGTPDSVMIFEYEGDVLSLSQQIPANIKTRNAASGITIFPNPSNNNFIIRLDNNYYGSVKMDILTVNGKTVGSYIIKKEYAMISFSVPATRLQKGGYLLQIRCGEMIETKKILID